MIKITENLHRAELTALERSKLVAEWCELVGEKAPQLGEVFKGGRGNRGGIIEAARQLPVPGDTEKAREHQVARAVKVASLSPEAQAVAVEEGLDWSDPAGGQALPCGGIIGGTKKNVILFIVKNQ